MAVKAFQRITAWGNQDERQKLQKEYINALSKAFSLKAGAIFQ